MTATVEGRAQRDEAHVESAIPNATTQRIWITWETQRRSISLAKQVGARLYILERPGRFRYLRCLNETAQLLFASRGRVVFVQNPSMVLAIFAAGLRRLLGYTLVVDRHSNFQQDDEPLGPLTRRVLKWMSRFSIRHADLTIVTNGEVLNQYVAPNGRGFILPDPYPEIATPALPRAANSEELKILFVSSWATDEPIANVMEMCRRLGPKVRVYISGRMKPAFRELMETKPENFVLTGFLPDAEYFKLMASVDAVMAISTRAGTLCCGAYEGITLGKPVILNDEAITRDYFSSGAVYSNASLDDLVRKIEYLIANRDPLTRDVERFYIASGEQWRWRLAELNGVIEQLATERN